MLWTENEVQKLRTLFLRGLPIKAMARVMDKSPGSVNKALTRLQIRPTKQGKPLWQATDELKASARKPRNTIKELVTLRETPSWQKLCRVTQKSSNKYWVSWQEVVTYLQQCGECVTIKEKGSDTLFYLGRRIVSRTQLLIRANQNRQEQRLPPYCVEAITE